MFVTNNSNSFELYDWLRQQCTAHIYSERLQICQVRNLMPDMIISYNYKYIISEDIIDYMDGRIFNLHTSYLPWNRGANPNIWSFIDHTPKGVTIHQISKGLDEGKILYQKQCFFDTDKETFKTSYHKLNREIAALLKEKWSEIEAGEYQMLEQIGEGSYHTKKDLDILKEKIEFDWDVNIAEFLCKYEKLSKDEI